MITARGLTKYYGELSAILDLDFDIQRGEIVGFLGLNGAGKTTCLRILACLLLPSTGRVTLGGLDVADQPHEIRKLVGFLPEEPPLYREMTVESYLRFAGELRGLDRAEVDARLEETLELTRTRDVRHKVIGNLSYGYRKRVGIGQAIIHQPPVLILDEPISGLDPVQIVDMREMIRGLGGRHTVLLSSHILPEISQTCDRLLVIQDGEIVAAGTEDELTSRLTGGHRLQLTVRGDAAEVEALVAGQEHVTECEVAGTHDGAVQVRVTTAQDLREQLSRELVQAGFGLLLMSPAEAELESIFLQLTRRNKEVAR